MRRIWKYILKTEDRQELFFPEGARVLCLQVQNEKPCIWVELSPENEMVGRTFETYGTNHDIEEGKRAYVGSYQLMGGGLVFHVYEKL